MCYTNLLSYSLKLRKWILKQHCFIFVRCEKHDLKKNKT